MKLPTLYKTAKSGAIQQLDMIIEGATYTRTWGQVGGKMQSKSTTATGKNIGKANETTPEQQAIIEAKAVWAKKQKANYSTDQAAPVMQKLPMKISVYQKFKHKITFPVFTSPKLNGVNAEYRLIDGELKLLSRGGEEYLIPEHQRPEVLALLEELETNSINGEMYIHGLPLQDITAAVKKHNENTTKLQFCVFDFPEVEGTYEQRCGLMFSKRKGDYPSIPFIQVWTANSHEEIDDQLQQVLEAGYEGLVIRNPAGLYKYNTRSLDVFKYKLVKDGEFKAFDFELDKNSHPVFNCLVDSSLPISDVNTFKVKLKGTAEERLAMGKIANTLLGQYIKIEYETLSKVGKPLKPVGITFRKVSTDGEALE